MPVEDVRGSGIFKALAWSEQFIQALSRMLRRVQGY